MNKKDGMYSPAYQLVKQNLIEQGYADENFFAMHTIYIVSHRLDTEKIIAYISKDNEVIVSGTTNVTNYCLGVDDGLLKCRSGILGKLKYNFACEVKRYGYELLSIYVINKEK